MHSDLSPHLHSEECNSIIKQLFECHDNNKFAKFLGVCNDLDRAMIKCLKSEKEKKRRLNLESSRQKLGTVKVQAV